jgi:uncharacterized protein YjeT (DUF2065 family)
MVALVTLLWLAPGLIWAWLAYPSPGRLPRLAVGAALGLALQIDLAAPLAATVGITRASVAITTVGCLALAIALGLAMRVRTVNLPSHATARRAETGWFVALAAISVAICAAPLAWQTVPDGWDPSFHSLLASVTIATGKLPTWRPYEPILSNYPYGAHIALADISLLTGLQPHQVFATLLNVVVPALAALQIYTLARRMWRRGPAALGAVAAYGLLGYFNSVDYGAWGGLPNALGLILLLAALEPFFAPGYTWRRVITAGALLSAVPLTHHHVALTAGLLFGVYAVALVALAALRRSPMQARRAARRYLLRIAGVAALAFALASYSFLPHALRGAHSIGDTAVFADFHEYSGWPFDKNGVALWLLAATGAALALWTVWRATPDTWRVGQRLRLALARLAPSRGSGQVRLFASLALMALFVAFTLGQFVFHDIMWALYHKDETAFSPPRFLSNMTYFLALFAGPAIALIWQGAWWGAGLRLGRLRVGAWMRPFVRVALIALTIGVAVESLFASGQVGGSAGQLAPGDLSAFQWTRAHTPADALVVVLDGADAKWAPYFTRREVHITPLPASEDAAGYPAEKRLLLQWALQALEGRPRLGVAVLASADPVWRAISHRPLVVISSVAAPALGVPAYSSNSKHVYVVPSLSSLTPVGYSTPVNLWWRAPATGAPPANWDSPTSVALRGWIVGASNIPGPADTTWLRLDTPFPRGAAIRCYAQDGAILYVDGVNAPHACTGALTPLPQLSAPGPHLIAVRALHSQHTHPWMDVEALTAP